MKLNERINFRSTFIITGCLLAISGVAAEPVPAEPTSDLMTSVEWNRLDASVDRALAFLATTQMSDGSFQAPDLGQPGITSLCVMAFLARGHVPSEGRYGIQLERAIDFVLSQQQENGLLFSLPIGQIWQYGTPSHTGLYNHAIAGLMLSEVYGMTQHEQQTRIKQAIHLALALTREHQLRPKRNAGDRGGWRYLGAYTTLKSDADLSMSSWQLMFLRSARNAEFDVSKEWIDDAMGYVRRSFNPNLKSFLYCRLPPGDNTTRAIVGSGILSLSLGGEHQTEMAKAAGEWVLEHPFDDYNRVQSDQERYHYSVYYCSQGMFQLGGNYWARFYPPLMRVLLKNQLADGSWPAESHRDQMFGNTYTTSLVVLSLTPPYQLLPIYQR
ncbi:prenyltransferase/squalene oxidase repeat-containing protein [Schlesneria paludicola]|uniref:prenyltransferase/squalene oxidase repeat-containing protein n=1 Tax=Schlesneria paludicola TaxID=360056 RepID=UPI0012FA79B8|nr:prenyltransferase/squalene oxidase repeat-containing protein [Schlesneria paludicola]